MWYQALCCYGSSQSQGEKTTWKLYSEQALFRAQRPVRVPDAVSPAPHDESRPPADDVRIDGPDAQNILPPTPNLEVIIVLSFIYVVVSYFSIMLCTISSYVSERSYGVYRTIYFTVD